MRFQVIASLALSFSCVSCSSRSSHWNDGGPQSAGWEVRRDAAVIYRINGRRPVIVVDYDGGIYTPDPRGGLSPGTKPGGDLIFIAPGVALCPPSCVFNFDGTVSVKDLVDHINNVCLASAPGCKVDQTTATTRITLNEPCPCELTVALQNKDAKPVYFVLDSDGKELDVKSLFPTVNP